MEEMKVPKKELEWYINLENMADAFIISWHRF